MPLYNVHIYREMKLRFDNIEADTPEDATRQVLESNSSFADSVDDCDGDTLAALVDLVGDDEFEHTKLIDQSVIHKLQEEEIPADVA